MIVLKKLVNNGAFHSLKEAKDSLRALKERKYILSIGEISMVGVIEAQKVEQEFKL